MENLINMAIEARDKSYCPYSGFAVGAALQTRDGKIYQGCNIENAAFTPTNCAERTAFFKAVSEGETEFRRIVIVGGKKGGPLEMTSPCGVCLQVMQEFCDAETFEVILATKENEYKILKLHELLPYGFDFEKGM
ncbi:MAG: cytidine deaminase [Eubacterium sp.]